MYNSNVRVEDIEGWHDDGWCTALIRARIVAERDITMIAAEVWLPEGGLNDGAVATMTFESSDPLIFNIPYGQPFKLSGEHPMKAGQELSLRIFCANRVNSPTEKRILSFNLLGFSAG